MKSKIKLIGIAALIAVIGFSMAGCDNGTTGGSGSKDTAVNIKAIPGVTAPVTGATPVSSITETTQYTGTVTWKDNSDNSPSGNFAASTAYTATITLTAKKGYTLKGVSADFFTVAGTTSTTNAANKGTVTAVFATTGGTTENPVAITLKAIPGVTSPVNGATPVTAPINSAQYTGTVSWNGSPSTFAASTVYTATIILTAKDGFTLTGVTANFFTVNGNATTHTANSGNVSVTFPATGGSSGGTPVTPEPMSEKTALQYFRDEGITVGINAGNSLDAVRNWAETGKPNPPYAEETAWGNPKVNQAYLSGLKTLGFDIIRIPVTWTGHIGPAPSYIIEESYLQRVAEVVNMARNAGLKAFINIHHDGNHNDTGHGLGGWLNINSVSPGNTEISDQFEKVWEQIAEYFINYGDWLMFQGFNEIHDGSWSSSGTPAEYVIINDWNQRFTNAVRRTGGNNANRYLLYYGYLTSGTIATESLFVLPSDSATGKQIVGFHYYDPFDFAHDTNNHEWDTAKNRNDIDSLFSAFKTKFIDNEIPVVIGENGPARYSNYSGNPEYTAEKAAIAKNNRLLFIDYLYTRARENSIVPFYWESGGGEYDPTGGYAEFGLINRITGQPNSAESHEVIERMINPLPPVSGGATPNPITGNMGNYTFGTQEDGVTDNYQQAVWSLTGANLAAAKTAGAAITLVLSTSPSAVMQLVWQAPSAEIYWKSNDILEGSGSVIGATGVTWNSGAKTLTIPLSTALDDYSSFTSQSSINLIIAYYGADNINDLGITSANLSGAPGGEGTAAVFTSWDAGHDPSSSITYTTPSGRHKIVGTITGAEGYANLTANPDAVALTQMKTMTSFSFMVSGDGKQYDVMIPTTESNGTYNHYRYTFTASASETLITVNVPSNLAQADWGGVGVVSFIQSNVQSFQFQLSGNGTFDLTVWDIKLH